MDLRRIFNYIIAKEEDLALEHRLLLSAIIIGLAGSLVGTIVSLIIMSSIIVIISALSLFIALTYVYYFVRVKKTYKKISIPIAIIALLGVSIIWLFDGGMNGSNILIAFVVLVLVLIIVPDKSKPVLFAFYLFLIIGLYIIQFYRPDLITEFSSEKIRWIDGIITASYTSVFIFFIISFLHSNYKKERLRAEENEKKFKALSENSEDSISRFDRQYRHIYINEAGIKSLGVTKAQILGKSYTEANTFKAELAETLEQAIESVFTSRTSFNEQYKIDSAEGPKYMDYRLFPEFNDHNEVVSVLGVSNDITLLKISEKLLMEMNTDKDRFITILGHDLKSPFTSLLGLSELLVQELDDLDKKDIEDYANRINISAKRIFDLLESLLSWARAQQGMVPYNPENLVLGKLIKEVLDVLTQNAGQKNINLECVVDEAIQVFADAAMIKTVIRNLISNSIKFTYKGGVVRIKAVTDKSDVIISVEDSGVGIRSEDINKLFDIAEFHSTTGTDNESGTGLGLLLCKEFVNKHGGRIWVESEPGDGSTFQFTLPVRKKL